MSASATPALEAFTDRALKLLEMEGQLLGEIEDLRNRIEGEFGRALTDVVERLSPGVEDAYGEALGAARDAV